MNNKKIIYADGSGDFRPERIKSMMDKILATKGQSNTYLKNIVLLRIYELDDLFNLIKKIKLLSFDILILDDIIPLFLYRFKEKTRLEVRRFIRELSLITLSKKISIIFTNVIVEKFNKEGENAQPRELFYHDIIRYVQHKFLLQATPNNKEISELRLVHPYTTHHSKIYIDLSNL